MTSFSTDQNAIRPYLTDESSAFEGQAGRIYFPSSAEEVAEILAEAQTAGVGVTVSGGGTSITGARVPTDGGWILATDRLVTVKPVADRKRLSTSDGDIFLDPESLLARVPAGLRLSSLDAAVEPLGLFYPPTLTERSAMIGGTIATNASGARSFRYGPTRSWVEGLTVVTPRGEILHLARGQCVARGTTLDLSPSGPAVILPNLAPLSGVKNVAGYAVAPGMDAVDLFVGGEGTLGVVIDAEIRLERRTGDSVTLLVFVVNRDDALNVADQTREGAFQPWEALAVEYFDRGSLDFMREAFADVPEAAAAVLIELAPPAEESPKWHSSAALLGQWLHQLEMFEPVDVWSVLPSEKERVRDFRHALPDRVNDYVRTRRGKLGTDLAVPGAAFRELMVAYDRASGSGVKSVLFGHLGEYHLHLNFLADDDDELRRARESYVELARTAVDLGGTVSAEHGIGKKRAWVDASTTIPYLELMVGTEGIEAMSSLKRQLDPGWILNRDTVLPWKPNP